MHKVWRTLLAAVSACAMYKEAPLSLLCHNLHDQCNPIQALWIDSATDKKHVFPFPFYWGPSCIIFGGKKRNPQSSLTPSKTHLIFTKPAKKCAAYSIYKISDSGCFLFEQAELTMALALKIHQTKTCKTDKQGLNLADSSLNMSSRFGELVGPHSISI